MKKKGVSSTSKRLAARKRQKRWKRAVSAMAGVVALGTAYSLILPAITMEAKVYCGIEEHHHDKDCYDWSLVDEDGNVIHSPSNADPVHTPSDAEAVHTSSNAVKKHTPSNAKAVVREYGNDSDDDDDWYEEDRDLIDDVNLDYEEGKYESVRICGKKTHSHTLICYSDPEADLETPDIWEATLPKHLSGNLSEDIAAVAESQLGYKESDKNYEVEDKTVKMGYTRYGEWYGEPYENWGSMFAAFCLDYAGAEAIPTDLDAEVWAQKLQAENISMFAEADMYLPKTGDLIFFKNDGERTDHMGIVKETVTDRKGVPEAVKVIEGNDDNQVRCETYELLDDTILGYGVLGAYDQKLQVMAAHTGRLSAKASCQPGVLPSNAQLQITELSEAPEKVNELGSKLAEYLGADPSGQAEAIAAIHPFDISFTDQSGARLEPDGNVAVAIEFSVPIAASTETNKSIWRFFHITEHGEIEELTGVSAAEIVTSAHGAVQSLSFQSSSFSDYVLAEMTGLMTLDENKDVSGNLTGAQLKINGKPYDGTVALNPGEQFSVSLEWELNRDELTKTLTYTYTLPEQIKVKDTEDTVLYDDKNERKGVYSIHNGVMTVTYDNVSDRNVTTFDLNAVWNQDKISQDTTIQWNDVLSTTVKFNNSQIAATKELIATKNLDDGSFAEEYAVSVAAGDTIDNITLTDTLTAEKFHFFQGYYEADGEHFDYRYKVTNRNGSSEYAYGNFPEGTFDEEGNQLEKTITISEIALQKGQIYTLEYAVKLDAEDRFELDSNWAAAGLINSATASYSSNNDTISSTVTVTDTYRAEEKWIIKERGNLGEGDVDKETDVPWIISVNPAQAYNMGGMVIGDRIETPKVVYNIENDIKITGTTDSGSVQLEPHWIQLSDDAVSAIYSAMNHAGDKAADLLYSPDGKTVLDEINKKVGHSVEREELSDYVFVNKSKNQFVWFTPKTEKPTSYELSYYTDISETDSNVLVNSAAAGWKQWVVGITPGYFVQEIEIEKKNSGTYQIGDDYFVDWTITLAVPENRNAISDVFLYDALPYHEESGGYDQLEGLLGDELDYTRAADQNSGIDYMKEIAGNAFQIKTSSENREVKELVKASSAFLGHPRKGMTDQDYKLYENDNKVQGQFTIMNGEGDFAGKRLTPARFGVWLGDLPDTLGKDGYTITVEYTTKVDPKLIDGLNGRAYGYNYAALMMNVNGSDVVLGDAGASYWVDHSNAQNVLSKNVEAYDPVNNIVTYRVNINPDATLKAEYGAAYILRDQLNLPGANYIEDSFRLGLQSTVTKGTDENGNTIYPFEWDSDADLLCWHNGWGVGEWESYIQQHPEIDPETWWVLVSYMGVEKENPSKAAELKVNNESASTSGFEFTVTNAGGQLKLAEPAEVYGNLIPMVLTYQVQLPDKAGIIGQEKIINTAALSVKPADSGETLLDGAKAEFDYTSALHKRLSIAPDAENGYTASFTIDVDKSVEEWPFVNDDTFTVSDVMSSTLVVDITSIEVYGIKNNGTPEPLVKENYTSSYDDRRNPNKNYLSVTIKDSDEYTGYWIKYDTKVQGNVGDTVYYDNTAEIAGTTIKSEEIDEDVFIQKQIGNVDETNYEVKLLKFDAGETGKRLVASFKLSAYEGGTWELKDEDLTTDKENGELVLNNTNYPEIGLQPGIWYKLEETNAPEGYLKGITYFRIGNMKEDEGKPEDVTDYTEIPLKGGTHQIPNYKASLRLHKIDEDTGNTSYLSGAEFELYDNSECTGAPLAGSVENEEPLVIYSINLEDLLIGKTYYLKETKAPNGYNLSETIYEVTINEEGTVTLTDGEKNVSTDSAGIYVIANKCGYELPQTGGRGNVWYVLTGLLFLCSSAYLLHRSRA